MSGLLSITIDLSWSGTWIEVPGVSQPGKGYLATARHIPLDGKPVCRLGFRDWPRKCLSKFQGWCCLAITWPWGGLRWGLSWGLNWLAPTFRLLPPLMWLLKIPIVPPVLILPWTPLHISFLSVRAIIFPFKIPCQPLLGQEILRPFTVSIIQYISLQLCFSLGNILLYSAYTTTCYEHFGTKMNWKLLSRPISTGMDNCRQLL